jgi:2-methylisocitrate lyase-like PEP mutase family enzyme
MNALSLCYAGLMLNPTDCFDTFRALHQAGCFVMPNPWDVGSARLLAGLGFKALATTSAGFAWSLGKADKDVTLDEALEHLRVIAASVDVPVNADFEGGYAIEPDGVAANVRRASETGIAGLSIEDSSGDPSEPLFAIGLAVARIRAARRAIDNHGGRVLLTGRSEGYVVGRPDLDDTIRRLKAYADAGADCLYAPRLGTLDEIVAVVTAVAPKPVNVLVDRDFTTVANLADLGVRRISVGGGLARVAWGAIFPAAREIAEQGTFGGFARAIPFAEIDGAFATRTDPGA